MWYLFLFYEFLTRGDFLHDWSLRKLRSFSLFSLNSSEFSSLRDLRLLSLLSLVFSSLLLSSRELSPRHPFNPSVLDVFSRQCTCGTFGWENLGVSSKIDFTRVIKLGYIRGSCGVTFVFRFVFVASKFAAVIVLNIYCRSRRLKIKIVKQSEKFYEEVNLITRTS